MNAARDTIASVIEDSTGSTFLSGVYKGGMTVVDIAAQAGIAGIANGGSSAFAKVVGTQGEELLKKLDDVNFMDETALSKGSSNESVIAQMVDDWNGKTGSQLANNVDEGYNGKGFAKGAGDYSSLAEKARNVDVSTSAHQAVYYSGKGNRARAEAFAELNGKTTLEMTPGGRYFDSLRLFEDGSPVTKDQAYEIWKILSERYAKSASGNVYGFVKGSFPESIFNTVEYPALKKNPYITNIFTELLN